MTATQRLSTIENERFHATSVDGHGFSVVVEEYAEDLWKEINRLESALLQCAEMNDWGASHVARKALNPAYGPGMTLHADDCECYVCKHPGG